MNAELIEAQKIIYTSGNPTRRWIHCVRRDWIMDAIRRYLPASRVRAMEVGPGSGVYLPTLAGFFAEVAAVDIEQTYLDHVAGLLPRYPNLKLQIDDITRSAQASGQYDLILCTEVIEHIPDSAPALKEIGRLLKSDGVLILSTPQPYSLLELTAKIAFLPGVINLVRWIYREPVLDNEHINLLSRREVEQQLAAAGFTIVERYYSGLYIPLIAEFTGRLGQKLEEWLESWMRNTPLRGLLWTQYLIARPTKEVG
jgi:2-polyprenyl-3-methyl-5-hydroxy-6-metoxy-1,4-benzoquinol methylase